MKVILTLQAVEEINTDVNITTSEVVANFYMTNYYKGDKGDTPYIGENGNWWVSVEDTGTRAVGPDGVGISNWELVSTVGKVKTYRIS